MEGSTIGDLDAIDVLDLLPPADDTLDFLDPLVVRKPKRVRVNRLAEELEHLRAAQGPLEAQITELQARRRQYDSKWGRLAQQQNALKLKAMRENEELHAALAEQAAFREYLERALRKRPLSMLTDAKWRALTLGAEHDERVAAIHAIAKHQYEIMEAEMINTGLMEPTGEVLDFRTCNVNGRLVCEGARYSMVQGDLATVANAALEILWSGRRCAEKLHGYRITSQKFPIDANTMHVRDVLGHPNGTTHIVSSMITKRFVRRDAIVIVWRSVLEDEGLPHVSNAFVNDEHGWIEYSRRGPSELSYKAYLKASSPAALNELDKLSDLVQLMHFDDKTAAGRGEDVDALSVTIAETFAHLFIKFERDVTDRQAMSP
ncbi:hypothetical protein ACHHYP_13041 [Achlya hypogyna]|uniref:M96 mating-specific protein family n=1 Tax=Achlya hypogyna TaxID=1202772 RepID=A0A1V9YG56_ACHHY|nr:hypothetical protein ACHHYP_13041 [Achlya hypogyna]